MYTLQYTTLVQKHAQEIEQMRPKNVWLYSVKGVLDEEFAGALTRAPLRRLHIQSVTFDEASYGRLFETLPFMTSLQTLILNGTHDFPSNWPSLLASALPLMPGLTELDIRDFEVGEKRFRVELGTLMKALAQTNVSALYLRCFESAISVIAETLPQTKLQKFHLWSVYNDHEPLTAFAAAICTAGIKELSMPYSRLTQSQTTTLLRGLHTSILRRLNLSSSYIDTCSLAELVTACPTLWWVDVSYCNITNKNAIAMTQVWPSDRPFVLIVTGNEKLSSDAFRALDGIGHIVYEPRQSYD